MAAKEDESKCFTFLWKLENICFSSQKNREKIDGPCFVVDAIDCSKWILCLYPRGIDDGNYIVVTLESPENRKPLFQPRMSNFRASPLRAIKYELAVLAKDGSVLKSSSHTSSPPINNKLNVERELCVTKRSQFLQDILNVRCRIWKSVAMMAESIHCTVRTHINVEKRFFLWDVKNFSALRSENKCTYSIKSIKDLSPFLTIGLCLTGGLNFDEIIKFELSLCDPTVKFSTFRLFLVDARGSKVDCNQDELWFDNPNKSAQFTLSFTKKKLLAKKGVYLPNDTLSLHWEWTFSKGITEEIEEVQYEPVNPVCNISEVKSEQDEKKLSHVQAFSDNLKSLYDKQFLCDVKLETRNSTFHAHKIILSASSSVFSAMFANNMKEKDSDFVRIEDLSDETVRRMLLYIYTSRMENVTFENVSHLYVAADKYNIVSLKKSCSSYMMDNLSPSNACEALVISDFHADSDLKSSVQEYILKHDQQIINSDEWKLLMETNVKLAAETLCLRYK